MATNPNFYPNYTPATQPTMNNWVNGVKDVENRYVMPGSTAIFWDNNEDRFYIKSIDALGKTNIKTYEFKEIVTQPPVENNVNYVTKSDFEEFTKKIQDQLSQIVNNNKHVNRKFNTEKED